MKKIFPVALSAALFALPAWAGQVEFSYSKLFTQLKHNVSENHSDVKVGYFMISPETGEVCKIEKAWMQKKEHFEEFVIPASQELPLPLDNQLRQVNPDVFVVTAGEQACDISFQVMANQSYGEQISASQINSLLPQMTEMMGDLGGMFSSWFMPDVKGVMVHFDEDLDSVMTSNGRSFAVNNKVAIIDAAKLEDEENILFQLSPTKITPWMPR